MQEPFGIAHFIGQTDVIGRCVLATLVIMSIASWYLILTKGLRSAVLRVHTKRFLKTFWNAPDLPAVRAQLRAGHAREPFAALLSAGFAAIEQMQRSDARRLIDAGAPDEFLSRALNRSIQTTAAHLEYGLTALASVGSAAPFVGLFGTVWGIYHALLAIGATGQGTLDKVAGPVGEALIMTALGLVVAIPAVLAYNAFTRGNRVILAGLEGFAHELYAFMATGSRSNRITAAPGDLPAAHGAPAPSTTRLATARG